MRLSVVGFSVILSSLAWAQLAPQAAYEGQTVSAVSLIASPHRDLQPLYPIVTQKTGEPYSLAKADASA